MYLIRSAMLIHRRPCRCAKSSSCGVRAICPVRLSTISDSTPACSAWASVSPLVVEQPHSRLHTYQLPAAGLSASACSAVSQLAHALVCWRVPSTRQHTRRCTTTASRSAAEAWAGTLVPRSLSLHPRVRTDGPAAGEQAQVHRSLGVPRPHAHAPLPRSQGEDVPWPPEILWPRVGICQAQQRMAPARPRRPWQPALGWPVLQARPGPAAL